MRVDSALFAVEEQNLYVDSLRETRRWAALLAKAIQTTKPGNVDANAIDEVAFALARWSLAGLNALAQACERNAGGDGPLGWTSKPRVFALCAKVILAAKCVLARKGDHESTAQALEPALDRLVHVGKGARLHGSLILMCYEKF